MKLITRWTNAAEAAEGWRRTYADKPDDYRLADGEDPRAVLARLVALGDGPHPDAVDAVVGNGSATSVGRCHECGTGAEELVEIGEEPHHESSTARVCAKCLLAAMNLIEP